MSTPLWNVITFMECQHLCFKEEDQSVRMNEQRTGNGAQQVLESEYQRFMPTEITFIFRKFEGYIPSGIGARSVPVSRQAGWLAGRQKCNSIQYF